MVGTDIVRQMAPVHIFCQMVCFEKYMYFCLQFGSVILPVYGVFFNFHNIFIFRILHLPNSLLEVSFLHSWGIVVLSTFCLQVFEIALHFLPPKVVKVTLISIFSQKASHKIPPNNSIPLFAYIIATFMQPNRTFHMYVHSEHMVSFHGSKSKLMFSKKLWLVKQNVCWCGHMDHFINAKS